MISTQTVAVTSSEDAELVSACLEGHLDSYGRIVERYQTLICSLAYSATGSLSRSEDLAQETFVTAWKQLPSLQEPAKLRPWLCGIARNLIGKALRRDHREPTHRADPLDAAEDFPDGNALPPQRAISREEETILWRAIEGVPELYREPLILFYREQQSVEKVATALDLTEETVRQRLSRGRKLLHQQVISFVEGALEDTNPGKAFTIGVIGALPVLLVTSAGASAATTVSAITAKTSAGAKTAGILGAAGAVLTAGVILHFSLLGFVIFLGVCIGYMMSRSVRQSPGHILNATRFWRMTAIGFGVFVGLPLALVSALNLSAGAHPGVYHAVTLWMGLIYLTVPTALVIWLWRWAHENATDAAPQTGFEPVSLKRFYTWIGLGMLVPAIVAGIFLYALVFQQSLTTQRLSVAELQQMVQERKDADFRIEQYLNGSQSLLIRLPESRRRVIYHAPVDSSTLWLLTDNRVVFKTFIEGKDFGQLGAPWRLLGLLAFFVTPIGAFMMLRRPRAFAASYQMAKAGENDWRARNALRAFTVSLALALAALASFIGLITRWDTRTITFAELPALVAEHPDARYVVAQYQDRSSQLLITPRGSEGTKIVLPADKATLAWLDQQEVPCQTIFQGRDFGHADPKPWVSMLCISVLLVGMVFLLTVACKGFKVWSLPFLTGFGLVFLVVFGCSFALAKAKGGPLYVSTIRVKLLKHLPADSKFDGRALVTSAELLNRVSSRLDPDRGNKEAQEGSLLRRMLRVESIARADSEILEIVAYGWDLKRVEAIGNTVGDEVLAQAGKAGVQARILGQALPRSIVAKLHPVPLIFGSVAGIFLGLLGGAVGLRLMAGRRALPRTAVASYNRVTH